MKHTNRQSEHQTRHDFVQAIRRKRPVTITYRTLTETEPRVRTIEPYDTRITSKGIEIYAMCRLRGTVRKFNLARVDAYTLHNGAFTIERPDYPLFRHHEQPLWEAA
ncbi:WYL domain-containing protein [Streptomyces sp. NPDC059071]|uniref:WYL domain-containing protein n=1 Tax=unclassified Streptomyces TaxID=2593676 RepID=UPI0036499C62